MGRCGNLWEIVMRQAKQVKSVGVDIDTYNKLRTMSKEEHRTIGLQIAKLVKEAYDKDYGSNVTTMGIGSTAGG